MGNQMFQYVFARSLSLKYNIPFKIDLSFLKRRDLGDFTYRDYDLDLYNINVDFINDINNVEYLNEQDFNFSDSLVKHIINVDKNVLLDGYWQSYKYFLGCDKQIKNDFQFKENIKTFKDERFINMINHIESSNSVLIHVRRTDYLNSNYHWIINMDYINKAVDVIKSKVDNPHFFIFSDDLKWCVDNIKLDNMTIVDEYFKGNRFSNYHQLMRMCKYFIISNSTFSWWAAWLCEFENKIVIAPEIWDSSMRNISDLIPDSWIRIYNK